MLWHGVDKYGRWTLAGMEDELPYQPNCFGWYGPCKLLSHGWVWSGHELHWWQSSANWKNLSSWLLYPGPLICQRPCHVPWWSGIWYLILYGKPQVNKNSLRYHKKWSQYSLFSGPWYDILICPIQADRVNKNRLPHYWDTTALFDGVASQPSSFSHVFHSVT